jgi:hypothetical protein
MTKPPHSLVCSERGAVLVQVAIALVGLMAMSAFVIDYGVLWTSRRQAQNSADAGAMAGAISLAFGDFNNRDVARASALTVAGLNNVWGQAPDVGPGDITFPVCPPGSPGAGTNSCIRVNVFRNQRAGGSPLPTFFGQLVGVNEQGVRATATAEALFGDSTDCVKPFAIPDKWIERRNDQGPAGWSEEDTYEHYNNQGNPYNPFDWYDSTTGFTPQSVSLGGGDHGRYLELKSGNPHDTIAPGWYHPVVINPAEGPGGANYRDNIANCDPTVIGPGDVLDVEPGNMVGPTAQGMRDLIAQDPNAQWDPDLHGPGRGGVSGGCQAAGTCAISPRLVAIPVYDPEAYDAAGRQGRTTVNIVKVIGFFIDRMHGNDVGGWITTYPSRPHSGMGGIPGQNFVVSVALVR